MKKIIFSIAFIILILNIFAQEINMNITKSERKADKRKELCYGIKVIGIDKENIYYLHKPYNTISNSIIINGNKKYYIEKISKQDLNNVIRKKIILDKSNRNSKVQDVLMIENKLYLISAFQDKKKYCLYQQTINTETLEIENNLQKIAEIDYKDVERGSYTSFEYKFSPDSSKVLISYKIVNFANIILKHGIFIYSNKMELIWQNSDITPSSYEDIIVKQNLKIDNDANVYILGTDPSAVVGYFTNSNTKAIYYDTYDDYYPKYADYKFKMHIYKQNGLKKSSFIFTLPNKFILNMTFLPLNIDTIYCAGVYSTSGMISAEGTFFLICETQSQNTFLIETKEFKQEQIDIDFSQKEMNRFIDNRQNKHEWDPFEYHLSEIKTDALGNKYFVAEQSIEGDRVQRYGIEENKNQIQKTNNLYVTRIGKDFKIKRIDKIKKSQYTLAINEYSSYGITEANDKLYFFYQEFNKNNLQFSYYKKGNAYIVELDNKGNQKRKIFLTPNDKNTLLFLPKSGIQISSSEVVFTLAQSHWKYYYTYKFSIL